MGAEKKNWQPVRQLTSQWEKSFLHTVLFFELLAFSSLSVDINPIMTSTLDESNKEKVSEISFAV